MKQTRCIPAPIAIAMVFALAILMESTMTVFIAKERGRYKRTVQLMPAPLAHDSEGVSPTCIKTFPCPSCVHEVNHDHSIPN